MPHLLLTSTARLKKIIHSKPQIHSPIFQIQLCLTFLWKYQPLLPTEVFPPLLTPADISEQKVPQATKSLTGVHSCLASSAVLLLFKKFNLFLICFFFLK